MCHAYPMTPNADYYLSCKSYQESYDEFCQEILDGIRNKKFIPIYRMADGEFLFIQSRIENKTTFSFWESLRKKIIYLIKKKRMYERQISVDKLEVLKNLFDSKYSLVAHGEGYTKKEIDKWLLLILSQNKLTKGIEKL